jgi:hypothetical protein
MNQEKLIGSAHRAGWIIIVALVTVFAGTSQERGQALFKDLTPQVRDTLDEKAKVVVEKDKTVTRIRHALLDRDYLFAKAIQPSLDARPTSPVVLNLFDDVSLTLLTDRVEALSPSRFNWIGSVEGAQKSRAVFVVKDNSVLGNIRVNGKLYQIRPAAEGAHAIREIDPRAFPDELPPDEPPNNQDPSSRPEAGADPSADADGPPQASTPGCGAVIDVMVVYTEDAKNASADIAGEIALAIVETNDAYALSGIDQRLRLVHASEVTYAESGNIRVDRDRLRHPSDNHMDDVHTLRNNYNADLVSLWVESGGCGIAYIMTTVSSTFESSGFSVARRDCATGNYTFGHELGHNMSARHDRYVDPANNSPYTYNHGHVNVPDRWRTIMGYNTECDCSDEVSPCPARSNRNTPGTPYCSRLKYFSNPDNTYGGDPMGVPSTQANAANNRLTLDNTATTIGSFRAPSGVAGYDLSLSPAEIKLIKWFNKEDQITAVLNCGGVPQPGKTVAFRSDNSAVASVSPVSEVTNASGKAKATVSRESRGNTTVRAEAEGKSDQSPVKVPSLSTWGLLLLALVTFLIFSRWSRRSQSE